MPTAYDYSAGAIAPAALMAADITTVMRYVSTAGNPKNISASEYAELAAAGITVGLVYETSADWMLGGYGAGYAAARSARAQASAVGYPTSNRLWYAADFDASSVQVNVVLAALRGAADAEGSQALVAVYGGYAVVAAAAAAGYAAPWQTVGWSNGQRSAAAVLFQNGQMAYCGGVQVDVNELTGALFPAAPTSTQASTPQEDDDMSTTSVNGRAGLAWPAGTRHVFEVNYGAAGQPDLVLNAELKLVTGPVYLEPVTVSHLLGTGSFQIPSQYIAACRGIILTVKSGPENVVYDATAV